MVGNSSTYFLISAVLPEAWCYILNFHNIFWYGAAVHTSCRILAACLSHFKNQHINYLGYIVKNTQSWYFCIVKDQNHETFLDYSSSQTLLLKLVSMTLCLLRIWSFNTWYMLIDILMKDWNKSLVLNLPWSWGKNTLENTYRFDCARHWSSNWLEGQCTSDTEG